MNSFQEKVLKELSALKKVGVRVPNRAFQLVETDETIINGDENGMTVGEAADLAIDLS